MAEDKEPIYEIVGKTVVKAERWPCEGCEHSPLGEHEHLLLVFDDGTEMELISWDYESYMSGFEIFIQEKEE